MSLSKIGRGSTQVHLARRAWKVLAFVIADSDHSWEGIYSEVAARSELSWHAVRSNRFTAGTVENASALCGTQKHMRDHPHTEHLYMLDIPPHFDAREHWSRCPSIAKVRNQTNCGDDWAIAVADTFTDRFCIAGGESAENPVFSAYGLLSCGWFMGGCKAASPYAAAQYVRSHGISLESCHTPQPVDPDHFAACYWGTCEPEGRGVWYYARPIALDDPQCGWHGCLPDEMRAAILARGPLVATMDVYEDFLVYGGGVYTRTSDKRVGSISVRVVGWGVEHRQGKGAKGVRVGEGGSVDEVLVDHYTHGTTSAGVVEMGVPFWICAASFGEDWGEGGFFRIRRGTNECGIEAERGAPVVRYDTGAMLSQRADQENLFEEEIQAALRESNAAVEAFEAEAAERRRLYEEQQVSLREARIKAQALAQAYMEKEAVLRKHAAKQLKRPEGDDVDADLAWDYDPAEGLGEGLEGEAARRRAEAEILAEVRAEEARVRAEHDAEVEEHERQVLRQIEIETEQQKASLRESLLAQGHSPDLLEPDHEREQAGGLGRERGVHEKFVKRRMRPAEKARLEREAARREKEAQERGAQTAGSDGSEAEEREL